jgi:hypothetical protein
MTLAMTGQNTQSPNQKKTSRSISKITKIMMDTIDNNDNMLVPWYLMAAYAYYIDDDPILEDVMFDRLAKKLLKVWDTVEHQHKKFLTKDMLMAGTYLGEYPSRVEGALLDIRRT